MIDLPWQQDNEGEYLILRSQMGIHELRQHNTHIFEPTQEKHHEIRHVYHITGEDEESDTYSGFFIFEKTLEHVDMSLGDFIGALVCKGFNVVEFDEPEPGDILAWEKEYGRDYEPDEESVIDNIVLRAMRNWDAGIKYYIQEWREQYGI